MEDDAGFLFATSDGAVRCVVVSSEPMAAEANADDGVEICEDEGGEVDGRRESYSMILKTFSGCFDDVTIVSTPAAVAISAAMSLVSIPPVPSLEPRVAVLTAEILISNRTSNLLRFTYFSDF